MKKFVKLAVFAALAIFVSQAFAQPKPKNTPAPQPKEGYLRLISPENEFVEVSVDGKNRSRLRLTNDKDKGNPQTKNDFTLALPSGEHMIEVFFGKDKILNKKIMIPAGKVVTENLPPLKKSPAAPPPKR